MHDFIKSGKMLYVVSFVGLFVLLQCIFNYASYYWCNVNEDLANKMIWLQNIFYMSAALLTAFVLDKVIIRYERRRNKNLAWILPVIMGVFVFLIWCGFGVTINGVTIALGSRYYFFHLRMVYIMLFMLVPVSLDWLIERKRTYEVAWVTVYVMIVCVLCFMCSNLLLPTFCCGTVILAYYWYKSDNKYKFLPGIAALLVGAWVGLFGINGRFEPGFFGSLFARLTAGDVPNEFVEGYLYRGEYNFGSLFRFANFYPIYGVETSMGILGVLLVVAIYVGMFVLLWKYVSNYAVEEEKSRQKFLLVVMAVSFVLCMLYEIDVWSVYVFSGLPFANGGGFIWIAVVYSVFRSVRAKTGEVRVTYESMLSDNMLEIPVNLKETLTNGKYILAHVGGGNIVTIFTPDDWKQVEEKLYEVAERNEQYKALLPCLVKRGIETQIADGKLQVPNSFVEILSTELCDQCLFLFYQRYGLYVIVNKESYYEENYEEEILWYMAKTVD